MDEPARKDLLDFGQAFKFVFEDPDWIVKVLLGGLFVLLSSLLIGIPFTAGYGVRVIKRTARGEARPLPAWDDLGGLFGEGLKPIGLYLLHLLAIGIVPAGIGCVLALLGGGLSAAAHSGRAEDAVGGVIALGIFLLYGVVLVLSLALAVYFPAALTRMVLLDRFGAGFEVRENLGYIRRNLGNYLIALLLYLVASFVAQFGFILLCIGVFPAAFWASLVGAWALGETARRDGTLPGVQPT
jgi:Protein of unknown function (DUF4013)